MALITHTIKGSTDGDTVTTDPMDTTGADFIMIAVVAASAAIAPEISDSEGNTWTGQGADGLEDFFHTIQYFYCVSPNVGASHTFTYTPGLSGKKPSIDVSAWAGVGASVNDDPHTSSTGTSIAFDPYTPSNVSELCFLSLGRTGGSSATPLTGFTTMGEVAPSGTAVGLALAYRIAPDTSTITPDWTWTSTSSARGGGISSWAYTPPPLELETFFIFGENGSVSSDRTALFNVDGVTRTVHEPDTVVIGSDLHVLGDLEIDGSVTGFTIAADSITNTELANMAQATIKGRASGAGTGDPTDLTANQVSTILDAATDPFVRTSDLPGAGVSDLDDLSDVIITAPTTGEVLKYNGSNWVNDTDATGGGGGGIDTTTAAYGSRPAAGNAGDLFFPDNGVYLDRDTGSVWQSWGPIFPLTPPIDGDFAWVNQGSTVKDTTTGAINLNAYGLGGNWRARVKTMPATPFTVTAWFRTMFVGTASQAAGLCFRNSGTDNQIWLHMDAASGWTGRLVVERYSPAYAGTYINLSAQWMSVFCLRIADNGTNRIYSFSVDGVNFVQVFSHGRTVDFTADQVGFGTLYGVMSLLSWKEA